jgi:hypothetical protein
MNKMVLLLVGAAAVVAILWGTGVFKGEENIEGKGTEQQSDGFGGSEENTEPVDVPSANETESDPASEINGYVPESTPDVNEQNPPEANGSGESTQEFSESQTAETQPVG